MKAALCAQPALKALGVVVVIERGSDQPGPLRGGLGRCASRRQGSHGEKRAAVHHGAPLAQVGVVHEPALNPGCGALRLWVR